MQKRIDDVLIVGTAHVSPESVAEVRKAIEEFQPDVVVVELCQRRYDSLTGAVKWEDLPVTSLIKGGNAYFFLLQSFLGTIQQRMGEKFGAQPGAEMVEAIRAAEEHNTDIVLGDRDIAITLKRAWAHMSLREKTRLGWNLIKALLPADSDEEEELDLEELMKEDAITAVMEEIRGIAPGATGVLLDERDMYLAQRIFESRKKGKVLAVVGAGHLSGITALLEGATGKEVTTPTPEGEPAPVEAKKATPPPFKDGRSDQAAIERKKKRIAKKAVKQKGHIVNTSNLEVIPKKISILKTVAYSIPILIGVVVAWLVYNGEWDKLQDIALLWILINGICSAIGAAIARGHPLTILGAFVAAPVTSLIPTIGAGWVAGLIELKMRTPQMKDFTSLKKMTSMKDFFANKVVRVLMVAALANLGSVIGTFIATYYIVDIGI